MKRSEMTRYILSKPESNFVVFTHANKRFPRADYLIRRALGLKYGIDKNRTFSHTGTVWAVNGQLVYYHQTWPRFKKEKWNYRPYNVIIEIDNYVDVKRAREKCEEMYAKGRGYGVGKLLNFAISMWIPGIGNTLTAGKVCSEAVAVSYPSLILGKGVGQHDIDPQFAHDALNMHSFNRFIVYKDQLNYKGV